MTERPDNAEPGLLCSLHNSFRQLPDDPEQAHTADVHCCILPQRQISSASQITTILDDTWLSASQTLPARKELPCGCDSTVAKTSCRGLLKVRIRYRPAELADTHFEHMMWGGTTTRQQLQESIRQLWRLSNVPQVPEENLLAQGSDLQHHLSVSREQEIASNLAFLSATTDDSLMVMAVCVEERSDGRGATIRIASNTGDLSAVTSGMRMLATVLEQAARRGRYSPKLDLKPG
jgi:hypothetical protein